MYDLTADGITAFYQRQSGAQRFYRRAPLSGIVDGSNKIFLLPLYPVLAPIALYLGATLQTLTTQYTLDATTGTVTFVTAPTVQPVANYTSVQLSNQQIVYFAWAGFDLMEGMYSRGYYLSSNSTTYAQAVPTSTNIYICTLNGTTPVDPAAGTLNFSTSRLQRAWFERCMEFTYLDSMSSNAALSDVNVRERVGGIAISTDHRTKNILSAKKSLWDSLISAIYSALDESEVTNDRYAASGIMPHSDFYESTIQWQLDGDFIIPGSPSIVMTH